MPRLPDRFDLFVRQARESAEPERQGDLILGALAGLKEWHFLNLGTAEKPNAAQTEIEDERYLLVFSDAGRIEDAIPDKGRRPALITIPTATALAWCVECRVGVLVNPPEDAALIPFAHVEAFYRAWKVRGEKKASGFWIPNMTSEEEDFWQEHGY